MRFDALTALANVVSAAPGETDLADFNKHCKNAYFRFKEEPHIKDREDQVEYLYLNLNEHYDFVSSHFKPNTIRNYIGYVNTAWNKIPEVKALFSPEQQAAISNNISKFTKQGNHAANTDESPVRHVVQPSTVVDIPAAPTPAPLAAPVPDTLNDLMRVHIIEMLAKQALQARFDDLQARFDALQASIEDNKKAHACRIAEYEAYVVDLKGQIAAQDVSLNAHDSMVDAVKDIASRIKTKSLRQKLIDAVTDDDNDADANQASNGIDHSSS